MARRSLKPQLNQIRAWVRQGRTDAWIAHQLEVSTSELREFRKQHGFTPDEEDGGSQELDLRDEIEAEIEAATAEEEPADDEEGDEDDEEDDDRGRRESEEDGEGDGEDRPSKPRRRRRGTPRRAGPAQRARGDLRPRRDRRLRALARRLDQGQPGLHRALGGAA